MASKAPLCNTVRLVRSCCPDLGRSAFADERRLSTHNSDPVQNWLEKREARSMDDDGNDDDNDVEATYCK